ncbi:MAG: hypothetical protein LBF74_08615, partial [Treponema sp.]|nr:hypothetical protein [Treponema sp.]
KLPTPSGDSITYEYLFTAGGSKDDEGNGPLPEKLTDPDINIDAGLRYNFQYYGFGKIASKSSQWNIRNGINYRVVDNNGEGGLILLRLGEGSIEQANATPAFLP